MSDVPLLGQLAFVSIAFNRVSTLTYLICRGGSAALSMVHNSSAFAQGAKGRFTGGAPARSVGRLSAPHAAGILRTRVAS